jgi:transcriptional regulator with XRE-family HTH domain
MKTIFAKNLKHRMEVLNMSIQTVAKALDVQFPSVWNWTRGKTMPSVEHYFELVDLLGLEPRTLLRDWERTE